MTRFQEELKGLCGEFLRKKAVARIHEFRKMFETGEILLDADGGAYWKESENYLPADCVEVLTYTGIPFSEMATAIAREKQIEEQVAAYMEMRKRHIWTDEELYEMQEAFGKGTTVVDVLTGENIEL